ncbi:HtaA domain-containing protein [Streptomyces sp. MP131-18]|uniref:HtaA domain-containing protein n=1 Tax=Streptomyces sp. MP131-18 TaxID=1857892 RepID=UPI00097C0A4F|nr:HtaA domain-containing protein [Streptomyces sp. MP131-18]ONK14831.1 Htaa [Streptomyces sp. MP131-18]
MTLTRPRPVRRGGLLLAAATATVLGVTSFGGQALADDTAPAAPIGLTDGTLDWGVKESFRRYLTGPIAGGSATTTDGARTNEDGSYRFTGGTGTYDPAVHAVDTAFDGSVHFEGHHGELDLKLSEFRVVTEGESGAILADVTVAGTTTEDVEFATLDLSAVAPGQGEGGALVFADIPATLTSGGAEAFEYNGAPMYQEGTELDPATLTVTPEEPEEPEEPGTPEEPGAPEEPGTPAPAAGGIHDGRLDWGVKESFRGYVTGPIANGSVELTGGAAEIADGYRFPHAQGTADGDAGTLDAAFDGAVRFTGHDGALDLSFSELALDVDGGEATLVADVTSKDRETGEVDAYDAIPVADLDLAADALSPASPVNDVITLDAVPATLTAEGAEAFAGFYGPGEALDPVTATLALTEDADLGGSGDGGTEGGTGGPGGISPQSGATGGALAATGGDTSAPLLAGAAAALAATGAAVVLTTRRRARLQG